MQGLNGGGRKGENKQTRRKEEGWKGRNDARGALAVERMARLDIDPGFRDVTPSCTPSFLTLCPREWVYVCLKGARVNELEGGREEGSTCRGRCVSRAAPARKGCGFENDVFWRLGVGEGGFLRGEWVTLGINGEERIGESIWRKRNERILRKRGGPCCVDVWNVEIGKGRIFRSEEKYVEECGGKGKKSEGIFWKNNSTSDI